MLGSEKSRHDGHKACSHGVFEEDREDLWSLPMVYGETGEWFRDIGLECLFGNALTSNSSSASYESLTADSDSGR